jgi:EAL domain-containing protein (putative c-di-GMP-specific phosphodiesterase class I)
MLQTADFAMYRAKGLGPGSIALYDEVLHEKVEGRLATTSALALALTREEFTVYYQPVVNIWTGELIGAEALLRWEHPSGVLVNPDDFIPIAEHSGLIIPIGAWVLEEACEQLVAWQATQPALSIAVNLSVRQILNPDIIATVRDALKRSKLSPADLSLELTESIWMEDIDYCARILTSFKELGVGLVIDDFGTGYSSLSYLKLFPFDAVKIDRSFVDGLGHDSDDSALVAAIIAMAAALNLEVTAEGVATQEQLELLRKLSCVRGQGYLLAQPMTAANLTKLIDEGHRWPVNASEESLSEPPAD